MKAAKAVELMKKFQTNHPKVGAFLTYEYQTGIPVGTVLELTVTKPGENPIATNMRVTEEDIELLNEIKNLK